MKVVLSVTGKDLESQIDPRFGRCRNFLVVDIKDNKITTFEAIENEGAKQGHGAGVVAAQQIGNLKPDVLISGNLGPNAMRILSQLNIELFQSVGSAKDAIDGYLAGKLKRLEKTVPGHFGLGGQGKGRGLGRGR